MFNSLFGKSPEQKLSAVLDEWEEQDKKDQFESTIKQRLQSVYMSDDLMKYNQVLIDVYNKKWTGKVGVADGVLVFNNGVLRSFTSV